MDSHGDVEFDQPETPESVRSPSDLIHFAFGVLVGAIGLFGMARFFTTFDRFVTASMAEPPEGLGVTVAMAVGFSIGIVLPAVISVVAASKWAWWRLAIQLVGVLASYFLVATLLDVVSSGTAASVNLPSLGTGFIPLLSAAVCALVFVGPVIARRWGTFAWACLIAGAVIVAVMMPFTIAGLVMAYGFGLAVGAGLLLIAGSPNRHPSSADLASAMRRSGIRPSHIQVPAVDARGSSPYLVTTEDGEVLFVKVVTVDERSSDLMFRSLRRVALKNAGDEPDFSSLRRMVEHEAYVSLFAAHAGVRTPSVLAGGTIGAAPYSVFLAFETVDGRSLDGVDHRELTDEVLALLWGQVVTMRTARIAHRDLRLANVMLDSDGLPWIIDFGFSEVGPTDAVINSDVAELIASTSVKVGADRAVAAADGALGSDVVCAAAGRMQLPLLSGATRTSLKSSPNLLDDIMAALKGVCGVERIELDPVKRFRPLVEEK